MAHKAVDLLGMLYTDDLRVPGVVHATAYLSWEQHANTRAAPIPGRPQAACWKQAGN
jgi:hypothetical protein